MRVLDQTRKGSAAFRTRVRLTSYPRRQATRPNVPVGWPRLLPRRADRTPGPRRRRPLRALCRVPAPVDAGARVACRPANVGNGRRGLLPRGGALLRSAFAMGDPAGMAEVPRVY